MVGREAQGHASVHDVLAQAEGQVDNALFCLLFADGVVVERTRHARHGRVVAVAILVAHHLLEDDGHLLLVNDVARGLHVGFRVAEEHRGIHTFDGVGEHAQHFIFVIQIRNHVRVVDAGEGLVVRVFQQGRGADGNGRLHHVEEGEEVLHQPVGELGFQEIAEDDVIVHIAQSHLVEVVRVHELVEHVRAEHHRFRDGHAGVLELLKVRMVFHQVVDEGQATPFAAQ